MPRDARQVTDEHAARLKQLGLLGVTCLLPQPETCTRQEMEHVRAVLGRAGVVAAQANAQYERLIDPDDRLRAAGIKGLQAACRCAAWLRADSVYVRPGSLNRAGHWTPHPENTSAETIERLVASLEQVVVVAEEERVTLAIEGHVVSTLDTAARVKLVLDAVGSPALRVNVDPVNFIPSIPLAFNNRAIIDDLFDTLGDHVVAAHIKDVVVEDRLVVHIAERPAGQGLLDMEYFLRRFEQTCPDGWVLIEHIPDEAVPDAAAAMRAAAGRAGLAWS